MRREALSLARTQAALGDFFNLIGTTATSISQGKSGWGGALANVSMLWGAFPQTAGGAPRHDRARLALQESRRTSRASPRRTTYPSIPSIA